MSVLNRYQQLSAAVTILSLAFLSLSFGERILTVLGYSAQSLGGFVEFVKLLLVFAVGLFLLLILGTLTVGYLVLTGWRSYRQIPIGIRLLAAILIGTVIVVISSPLSLILPIPFVPVAVTATVAWYALRRLSKDTPSNRPDITQVENAAVQHLRTQGVHAGPFRTLDLQLLDNMWNGIILAGETGTPYHMKIRADNATVISSEKIVSA